MALTKRDSAKLRESTVCLFGSANLYSLALIAGHLWFG